MNMDLRRYGFGKNPPRRPNDEYFIPFFITCYETEEELNEEILVR